MILDETRLASTVLDGDGEATPTEEEKPESEPVATLLDGEDDDKPKEGDDGDSSKEEGGT